jgi:transketolase
VIADVDGHDAAALDKAIVEAREVTDKPTMICCKTTIGYGSPNKAGTHGCHGAPLGEDEVALTRKELGWEHAPFVIPQDIYDGWDGRNKGLRAESEWNDKFAGYKAEFPELAAEYERRMAGDLPADWASKAAAFVKSVDEKGESLATRQASLKSIEGYAPLLPEIFGGSADLGCSNLTEWSGYKPMRADTPDSNYVNYGVREFGMSAIMNGIALHGGFIPFGATFLMFSEYARNALRMAALMKVQSIFVYTHDSIGLGEDGPTHQAIEQIPTLRMIPGMSVWRPCDTVESAVAWQAAIEQQDGPSCLIFSRQGLPHQARTAEQIANIRKGGYILKECDGTPDVIIIATGSEVALAMGAAEQLADKKIRVVSMPSTTVFDAQDEDYRELVLPGNVTARVAVEAAVTDGWYKYVGLNGAVVGIDRFGESAPAGQLFELFGFTVDNVVKAVNSVA